MEVFEHIVLKKKRSNSKSWEFAERHYDTRRRFINHDAKQKQIIYRWINADSIEQVEQINSTVRLVIMSPLGHALDERTLDARKVLDDAAIAPISSIEGKRIVVAHTT